MGYRLSSGRATALLTCTTAVVAWGLLGAVPAGAATPPGPHGLADSASLSSAAIVSGTLSDSAGTPVGAGHEVLLRAWPSQSELDNESTGSVVPLTPVGVAYTDAQGRWTLRYSNPTAVAQLANGNGVVNLEIESSVGGVPSMYSISRRVTGAAINLNQAATSTNVATDSTSADSVALKPISGAAPVTTSTGGPAGTSVAVAASPDQGGVGCGLVDVGTYGSENVQVGEGYTFSGAKASLTYKQGADSTLGIAVSGSGKSGTFSADGSTTSSSSQTESETPHSGSGGVKWTTEFIYDKYGYTCAGSGSYSSYQARPRRFIGGANYISSTAPSSLPYCVYHSKGSATTIDSSTAYKFGAGVGTAGDIGVNLTAQTGFTSETSLTYSFSENGHLCGTNDYPTQGGSPVRIVAKS